MMRPALLSLLAGFVLASALPLVALAADPPAEGYTYDVIKEDHKIRNKFDLEGSFENLTSHTWGAPLAPNTVWNYSIHIKEAMNGDASSGSIHFWSGEVDFVGQVKGTKANYTYDGWASRLPNLAAWGTTVYEDQHYYFMFLYAADTDSDTGDAMWLALSTTDPSTYWEAQSVWPGSLRAHQLHSPVDGDIFEWDPKLIH